VLRHESQEKLYVPVELASRLNLWREGQLSALDEQGIGQNLTFPAAVAYSPPGQEQRVREDLDGYKLVGEKLGTIDVPVTAGPVWAVIEGGTTEVRAALARLGGVRLCSSYRARLDGRSIVALPADDPRWRDVADGRHTRFGWVGTRGERPDGLRSYPLEQPVPGVGDLLTTPRTLRWLLFDPRTVRYRQAALVRTTSAAAALALHRRWPDSIRSDVDEGWCWLSKPARSAQALPDDLLDELRETRPAGSGLEWIEEGELKAQTIHDDTSSRVNVAVQVVPPGVFGRMARRTAVKEPLACLWVGPKEQPVPEKVRVEDDLEVPVVAALAGAREAMVVTPATVKRLGVRMRPGGLVAWGRWPFLLATEQRLASFGYRVDSSRSRLPGKFVALVAGDLAAVKAQLPATGGQVTALNVVQARLHIGGRSRTVQVASAADWPDREASSATVWLHPSLGSGELALEVKEHRLDGLRGVAARELPANLVLVDSGVFREAAFHSDETTRMPASGTAQVELVCSDALGYRTAQRR
jgi:hypothetical protein